MTASRLSLALESGAVSLPAEGRIAVMRPRRGHDLSALPKDRVQVIQGFYPDYQYFEDAGFAVSVDPHGGYQAAVVFVPRARAEARALIARAMQITGGGPVIVDGQKTDGIDSLLRDCRKQGAEVGEALSKAHGKLFCLTSGDFAGWDLPACQRNAAGFWTAPGLFSADAPDRGSVALAEALPGDLGGRVADLGAGWGYLSVRALQSAAITECHLIEAEHAALECARRNIKDERAAFRWADATTFADPAPFDHVITNPPFHTGRAADPGLGRAFIAAAGRLLGKRGTLWLVANRHLPYEAALSDTFAEIAEVGQDPAFKVIRAQRPKAQRA